MVELHFSVAHGGSHTVLSPLDEGAQEYLEHCRNREIISCSVRKPRNPGFHRKAFALLNLAYAYWNPNTEVYAQKDFEAFRKQITILAGFYRTVHRINGDFELVSDSLAFSSMDQARFEQWYSAVLDVVLSHIMVGSSAEEIDERVNNVLEFA